MATLIELTNVSIAFNKRKVLDNVSLSLRNNEITTIVGPNGAGKSTLLKIILGLQKKYDGVVSKQKSLCIGYVPQKLRLNDTLPLHVDRFLKLAGKYSEQERLEALSLVGAEHLNKRDMHKLSGGETQRVLLARALLQRPNLLVLDEPAQGVDIQGQVDLYELIDTLRHRFNCAILMVSHDLHLVMAKTDNVICLHHHICCQGAPQDIAQHPSYISMFSRPTSGSLAFYEHKHNQHHHDLSGDPVKGEASTCQHHNHGHQHD